MTNEPLGLPRGSVRAVMSVTVVWSPVRSSPC